ncbi:unnamed protein product [Rotaria sordida]|uniref:Uncharacterized protein n=1 Tax=Rotaria sordida TaxID=392033 RepID=A0A819EFB4_9BILA|nr:unnamed protein product [Rotaria sordida]CAF3849982.1 unnamed protein product [Rotaria sordida]
MTCYRKLQRYVFFIRQHSTFLSILLTIIASVVIFRKELTYQLYIKTLNLEPYENAITIWSSDYHISPIHDLKNILSPLGVRFFDKSLSYSCGQTRTCFSPLRILTRHNGMDYSNEIYSKFHEFYKNQIEMNVVDAFVCFHPVSMCELYMPFNRSIIIISSTRYELSRFEPQQWNKLNENLKKISQNPKNIIAANNLYDAEYIRYFTGINVTLLPSFCNYTNSDYNPTREEFLLAPIHLLYFDSLFKKLLKNSLNQYQKHKIKIVSIRSIYRNYKYSDLTNHPAIIHIPYQVSIMSLFEQYRMNIPLLAPSLDLLTKWHYEYGVVNEKTWDQTLHGIRSNSSRIKGVLTNVPDPNNDLDRISIRYWLNFSDFYQWPHIIYYESIDDLIEKLISTDFRMISEKMKIYNKQVGKTVLKKWQHILNNIKQYSRKFRQFNS